jgi:hypothetical protein
MKFARTIDVLLVTVVEAFLFEDGKELLQILLKGLGLVEFAFFGPQLILLFNAHNNKH